MSAASLLQSDNFSHEWLANERFSAACHNNRFESSNESGHVGRYLKLSKKEQNNWIHSEITELIEPVQKGAIDTDRFEREIVQVT